MLVVDDDRAIRALLQQFLSFEGFEVVLCETCQAAFQIVEDAKHDFQFLVTDWQLPDGSGIDLIRHVRRVIQSHYIYMMMVTSHSDRGNLTAALNAGADDFLPKPIDRDELVARVRCGQRILDLESRLVSLANNDMLTGLPTRRVFEEMVGKEWNRSRRYRLPFSCVLFDIDYFKRINDIHGHAAGDQVLREISQIFAKSVRKSDIICRFGGEEFCAVLPETTAAQACIWAENVRKRIAETDIVLDSAVVNVTSSMGVAEALAEMEEASDLIDLADQCLTQAKTKGRNQVVSINQFHVPTSDDPTGHIQSIFHEATASDAMTPVVTCVTPDSSVIEISQFFLDYRIPSAPVVDDEGNLIGIVSEKDLMAVAGHADPHKITIAQVMRRNLVCYPPQISLQVVWEFLNRVSIRTVLISDNGKVVGVLSRQSILRWLANTAWKKYRLKRLAESGEQTASDSSTLRREHAARMLAETSRRLFDDVAQQSEDDHAATVIGTVSKMQDLMTDLLATLGAGAMSLGGPPGVAAASPTAPNDVETL